ncbi:unnamed protein product [Allacma fusca]|uniref:Condensin complex subunit 1 n=1 Tax=Allacma fusca TaxID=39272 RepID=A0A8J2JZK3_9HEXA|nr:unnamed protein product [Allacma fusca]
MDENELEVVLEKEDVIYEDSEEDLNGNEYGILRGLLEDFATHEGTGRLVSNFRVVLRVVEDPGKVDAKTLKSALDVICKGLEVAQGEASAAGPDVTKLSREQWRTARKSTITLLFLFFKAVTNIESKYYAEQHNLSVVAAVQPNRKRGNKKASAEKTNYPYWEEYRQSLLIHMNALLKCSVEKLWPAAANFFRGVTLAVCQVIANPAAKLARNDELVDNLFDVLGQLCSRYDEESGVINRLVPLIKNSEDTARVIAQGINRLSANFERDRIIFSSVKEVLQMYNNQLERETPAERSVATFMQEISVLNPQGTIMALPFVVQFLESESSTIRGAVLCVAAELLTWSKSPDATVEAPKADENQANYETLRDDVLHHLLEHIRDTNALVRNKALQLCTKLITESLLYLPEIVLCAEQGKRRLMDKAVTTRKCAISLLSAAVYADPIVIKFSSAEFRKQIRVLREELIAFVSKDLPLDKKIRAVVKDFIALIAVDKLEDIKLPENINDPQQAIDYIQGLLKDGEIYDACKFLFVAMKDFMQHADFKPFEKQMNSKKMYLTFFKKLLDINLDESMEGPDADPVIEDAAVIESDQCKAKRHYIKYMESCHSLSTVMESALPSMTILLELGTAADKAEVIECFAVLTESGYSLSERVTGGIIEAVAQMDAGSRKDLMDSVWRIFLKGCTTENETIGRIFEILENLSTSQREHMGTLVHEMVRSKTIGQEHFQILWDAYGQTNPAWTSKVAKHAAFVLGIVGRTHPSVITSNITYLIDVGLGPKGMEDFHLAQNTCEALMLLCPKPPKNPDDDTDTPPSVRFPSSHSFYENLSGIILFGLSKQGNIATDTAFQKTSELIMHLIYRTCMDPKKIVLELLESMHKTVFGSEKDNSEVKNTERVLCRYLNFVTGVLAAHVFYYENVVLSEVKRRKKQLGNRGPKSNTKKSKANVSKANKSTVSARSRNATLNSTAASVSSQSSVASTPNSSEINEMDVIIGNIGYDAELETIRSYLEKIINEPGAFRQMRTHTLFVCSRLESFKSLQLKIAAVRALARIMSISSMSVARNADVLLGLWTMVKKSEVRCELLRAAILLNVRYPNQMERCNTCLLDGLQDPDDNIRMATLDFITFLALNDLVKIREQLTDVAACLTDPNVDVREMAKDLLEQCGEKDNMLSNALPDILSRLSCREDISQESFQQIMKFLLERVKKDKLLLGFVEKLILRFRVATKGRQCQDVAFCLNQLSFNDKSFKIIKENFMAYQDKLGDEYVFDAFNTIIANLRKTAKPDFKLKLDELEKDLVVARHKCHEKERMEEAAVRKVIAGAPADSSDSDFVEEEMAEENNSEKENQESADEEEASEKEEELNEVSGERIPQPHQESSNEEAAPVAKSINRSKKSNTAKKSPRKNLRTYKAEPASDDAEEACEKEQEEEDSEDSETMSQPDQESSEEEAASKAKSKAHSKKSKPAKKSPRKNVRRYKPEPASDDDEGKERKKPEPKKKQTRRKAPPKGKPQVESDNEDPEEHVFSSSDE